MQQSPPARSAPELVVHAASLVPLCADDVQAPQLYDSLLLLIRHDLVFALHCLDVASSAQTSGENNLDLILVPGSSSEEALHAAWMLQLCCCKMV